MTTHSPTDMPEQDTSGAEVQASVQNAPIESHSSQTQEQTNSQIASVSAVQPDHLQQNEGPTGDVTTATKDTSAGGPVEQPGVADTIREQTIQNEPIFSGFLSYRKASATFPIFHKRFFFFFSDEALPLERLHALYDKYQKTSKVDKSELNHLVAHAATSGKGLLFFAKSPDAVPSGILECSKMVDIKRDDHMQDKFLIIYGTSQVFSFEASSATRDAWIAGIQAKRLQAELEVQQIKASAIYASIVKALDDGTAFRKVVVPEGTIEVLPDDVAACKAPSTLLEPSEKPKDTRRTSTFLTSLRDKLPHDKNNSEPTVEAEKSLRKGRRKSFFSNFLAIKDIPAAAEAQKTVQVPGVTGPDAVAAAEVNTAGPNAENKEATTSSKVSDMVGDVSSTGKGIESPRSPIKDKVDDFLNKFFHKKSDPIYRDGAAQSSKADFKKEIEQSSSLQPDGTQVNVSRNEVSPLKLTGTKGEDISIGTDEVAPAERAATSSVNVVEASSGTLDALDNQTSDAPKSVLGDKTELTSDGKDSAIEELTLATVTPDRKGLTRRLTSLFKPSKKSVKPLVEEASGTMATSEDPPQLPETAKVYDVEGDNTDRQAAIETSGQRSGSLAIAGKETPDEIVNTVVRDSVAGV